MSAAADTSTGRKYFLIDALDECDKTSQKTLLCQLRDTFDTPDAPPNVRMLITSRPYPEIRNHLEFSADKDLASFPGVKLDIDQFIEERVTRLKYTNKVSEQVADILRQKAQGTFLWVGIACNELQDTPSKDAISCLKALPTGLNSLYDKLLSTALEKEKDCDTIRLILRFVAISLRPLSLLELSAACRLCQDEEDMETQIQFMQEYIEACRLMVVIQDDKALLLHQSVKDFLFGSREQSHFDELQAHADLSFRCLDQVIEQFHKTKQRRDYFSDYATTEWPNHARMAQSRFLVMPRQSEFFAITSPCRESWVALVDGHGPGSTRLPLSILHVAARWGISALVEHVLRLSCQHEEEEDPIHRADVEGKTSFSSTSISKAVGLNENDYMLKTPLHYAVIYDQPQFVTLLLSLGAKLTTDVENLTPFHYAISKGSNKLIHCFLSASIPIDTTVTRQIYSPIYHNGALRYQPLRDLELCHEGLQGGLTGLHYAALTGSEQMTRLLLDHGANPNATSHYGETPLHLALRRRLYGATYPEVTDRWNDPEFRIECTLGHIGYSDEDAEEYAETAAWVEAERLKVITLLLDCDRTDVTIQDIYGLSPLHCIHPEQSQPDKVVSQLVQKGASLEARSTEGQTPLHIACSQGSKISIASLIEHGADVAAPDMKGRNAFHCAAKGGNLEILSVLVANVSNAKLRDLVSSRDRRGRNALHYYFLSNHRDNLSIAKFLLQLGVRCSDADDGNMSPLSVYLDYATMFRCKQAMVNFLLQNGCDPYITTHEGGYTLAHLHARSPKLDIGILKALANFGLDLRATDNDGRTLLHHSAMAGSLTEESYQFLQIEQQLSTETQDTHGKTSLEYAVEKSREDHHWGHLDGDRWQRTKDLLEGSSAKRE